MNYDVIDAHIHFDKYDTEQRQCIISEFAPNNIRGLVTVSMDLDSCKANLMLNQQHLGLIYPAFGFHPEQELPEKNLVQALFQWIDRHKAYMVAVGEVGLPYYSRKEAEERGEKFVLEPYIDLLEQFIVLAKSYDKPIVLHAVYEDADIACDLLEKHGWNRAHFHWYKGSKETTSRMMENGYMISVTPDIFVENDIRQLVLDYPLEQMMVETDGPWPFEGPFTGELTHPRMVQQVIDQIAEIRGIRAEEAARFILENTKNFYSI